MKTLTHIFIALMAVLIAGGCLAGCNSKSEKDKELAELRQIAEMDRREMENQYADFAAQYGEMKQEIKDDSLVAKLDAEQKRAEGLLKELRELKTNSAAEILRLKKELATVRAVLRDYIRQVDSLQRLNQTLTSERDEARAEAERTRRENSSINERNSQLSEQVAVASQLNATGVSVMAVKKNGKAAKRDVERMMQQAEQDAKNKVSETEVLGIAREKSHEIVKKAEDRSREMYRVANEYTEDALRRTEEAIQMALEEVKQSRVRFRAASAEQMQKRREELAQSAEKQTQNG